jgi:hypothetical protein
MGLEEEQEVEEQVQKVENCVPSLTERASEQSPLGERPQAEA